MDRFPATLFPPNEWQWRLEGSALSGGQPISGAPQTADMSGGGWWVCDWSPAMLYTRAQHGVWRAILGELVSGVHFIEVPVIDFLQPWPAGVLPELVTFGDGSSFSDGSLFDSDDPIAAELAAAVYMPAWPNPPVAPTQAQIQIDTGSALQGGEYFTIIGPTGEARLHMVTRIKSVAGAISTVCVVPPFREDMAAGTLVDFNRPRLLMKLDISQAKGAWATLSPGAVSRPKISFAEAFPSTLGD